MKRKIYLAIPFSGIRDLSFRCASEVASILVFEGNYVFSPISHCYPIQCLHNLKDAEENFWLKLDKVFFDVCDEVWVVNIVGVEGIDGMELIKNSKGVQLELEWAKEQNKFVVYVDYDINTKRITYNYTY